MSTPEPPAPPRPSVDVVAPFHGTAEELAVTRERLRTIELRPGDSMTIVDNAAVSGGEQDGVIVAADIRGSYFARNRGAERGHAEWIVFLDADVRPQADLLDRYFEPLPDPRTGLIAGGILDEGPDGAPLAVRYAALRRSMSHETTLAHGQWAFAQTANCAVRREAFEGAGGFDAGVRSGGDADLAYRLADGGWKMERRDGASVVHINRATLTGLLAQRAKHGAGAAWLASRHAGAFPARRKLGLVRWSLKCWLASLGFMLRREWGQALVAAIDPLAVWAFELGRRLDNQAPAAPAPRSPK